MDGLSSSAESTGGLHSYALEARFPRPCPPDELQALLDSSSAVASIEEIFPSGHLPSDHPFSWCSITADPKKDHGETSIRGTWYKTMTYHLLHTGGFVRLCTMRGRAYWNAQNETGHTSPDWKLHFSCELEDIGVAWDILAALFMEMKCEIGMKATYHSASEWPEGQRGRELTVYVYKWHWSYAGYMQGVANGEHDHEFYMDQALSDIYSCPFWFNFVRTAEKRLAEAGVRSRGLAEGDLKLPGCVYASLRNEAFVEDPEHHEAGMKVYPPNACGWNAAGDMNPFLDVIFFLKQLEPFMDALNARSA
eukprot:TRINITY_DN33958_c0_g1_i1.p1 TRINITY_DN33958_c0_g1~~TRINITY_DN33958_c0_g1_i1.p1  ORF type:complete len:307 (-),score=60.98 TRINITY_DN33958_c0_g1_i1:206-1126(-)